MVDVFVSYASQDRDRVRPIVDALENVGWSVWWDRQIDAGSAFDREIEKAIDNAKCVVVVWSADSVDSEWVRTEANEGLEKNVLVPVMIEPVRLPLAFRRIQTIDLSVSDTTDALTEAIARFVALPTSSDSNLTPFVGREKELLIISSRITRVDRSEGDFLLLSGEVGVGKSRLTQEAARIATAKDHLVLTGHCLDMDGALPYQPLIEQVEQASRFVEEDVMRLILGENAPEMSKLMPELRQRFKDIPEPVELPPEQERRYLLHGVGEFIHRAADARPMMLIFEDLHLADESTCILLRYLANRLKASRVLMIGTYRHSDLDSTKPFSRTVQELNRERLVEDLFLKNLPREQVEQLLARKSKHSPPTELTDLVYSETEGNPFFVEELYRHLLNSGKMFNDAGEFSSGIEIADTDVPRGVRLIISERLDHVSSECRSVLTIAAVIGRQFNFDVLLTAATKMDDDDLLDAMDEALAASLVSDLSQDREAKYGFAHEQVRQTLLSELSFPRRQRMHLRVAGALESYAGDNVNRFAGEMSYHLYQAGAAADEEKTIRFLLLAAEREVSATAFEDALRHFDLALGLLPKSDNAEIVQIHSRQAAALKGLEKFDEALDTLKSAIAMLEAGDLQDDLVLQRCRMLLDIWRGSEAIEDLDNLLERRKSGDDRDKVLETLQWVSRAYYVMSLDTAGYAEKTMQAYEDTIELARELQNKAELGRALVATAQLADYSREYVLKAKGNLDEAELIATEIQSEDLEIEVATARLNIHLSKSTDEYGETVLTKLLSRRDPIRLNAHYFRMMWSTYGAGRLHRCIEICDDGIELAYRIGTLPVQYPTIKGLALLDLGQFSNAWGAIGEEIADEAHRFGAALQSLGRLQYELDIGAFDDAMARAPWVIEEAKALSRVWMLRWVADTFAGVTCLPGNEDRFGDIEQIIESTGYSPRTVGSAAISIVTGDYETAMERLETRISTGHAYLETRGRLAALTMLIRVQQAAGKWAETLGHIHEALDITRECDMFAAQWRLWICAAKTCSELDNRKDAAERLESAEAVWQQVADTIPNPDHLKHYTRLAEQLGI